MAKSPLERQLEAQMKQEKQLANKQKREGERRAREQKKMEREAMIRERAASIVNGQPLALPRNRFKIFSLGSVNKYKAIPHNSRELCGIAFGRHRRRFLNRYNYSGS